MAQDPNQLPPPQTYYTGDPNNPVAPMNGAPVPAGTPMLSPSPDLAFNTPYGHLLTMLAQGQGNAPVTPLNAPLALTGNGVGADNTIVANPYAAPGAQVPADQLGLPAANNFGTGLGPQTAFGQRFTGIAGPNAAMDPEIAATQFAQMNGIGPYSGAMPMLTDYAQGLPTAYMLLNGRNALDSNNNYADWAGQALAQGNTPGGAGISTADFFNGAFTNDTQNPIFAVLHLDPQTGQPLDPDGQVSAFVNVMGASLQNALPSPVLNSMVGMYRQAGIEYKNAIATGQYTGSFTDFLQSQGLGPQLLAGGM